MIDNEFSYNFYSAVTNVNQIVSLFLSDKKLMSDIKVYFKYKEYTDDIIQDIIIQILEHKDKEKIIELCLSNKFRNYIFSILRNQKYNSSSITNKYYTSRAFEINEEYFESNNDYKEKMDNEHKMFLIDLIKKELLKLKKENWYQEKVFTQYVDLKQSYREQGKKLTFEQFGDELNIHKNSLFEVIKKVKIKLKQRINGEL